MPAAVQFVKKAGSALEPQELVVEKRMLHKLLNIMANTTHNLLANTTPYW